MISKVRYCLIAILTLCFSALLANNSVQKGNRKLLFDYNWKFIKEDVPNASDIDLDTKNWRNLDLPHDWSIEGEFDKNNPMGGAGGYLPDGIGWYRKIFKISPDWMDKKVIVYFEGVYMNSEVFINGTLVGKHPYGYTSFSYDLTPYLNFEGENVISVRVDNSEQINCRWYSGSGIYRHVWLSGVDKTHIDPWGIGITTPDVDKESATVKVKTLIKNEKETSQSITLSTFIKGKNANNIGINEVTVDIHADSEKEIVQTIQVNQPLLWTPDNPNLYTVQISLKLESETIDRTETSFGIRTIEYSAETGFLLNGESIALFGGCVHHDNGCLGAKAYDRAEERKVELLKAAGFNSVRTSHNLPSEAFLDACDRLGLMVIDESFDGWRESKTPHDYANIFDEWWEQDIKSMVLRDRNHPSIIIWSIGNEIIERTSPEAVKTARMLANAIKEIDITRPITSAMTTWEQGWTIFDPLMAEHDICGYNYQLHESQKDHDRVPSRVIVHTESYPKDAFYTWNMVDKHPYIIGDFVWTAMDYLGESGIGRTIYPGDPHGEHWEAELYPWHGSYCGDIDLIGWRKPISHYRDLLWNNTEKLYMAVREPNPNSGEIKETMWAVWPTWESWTWPGYNGKNIVVEVYSKYSIVRLYLNEKFIGEKATTRNEEFKAIFTLPYNEGVIKAVGVSGNQEMESTFLTTVSSARKLHLTADRKEIIADGQDLSFVTVEVVDKNGNLQPNAENLLKFNIEGPGEIIGVDNANTRDTAPYVSNTRKAWRGRALVVIKSNQTAGKIKLSVCSEELPDAKITIKAS